MQGPDIEDLGFGPGVEGLGPRVLGYLLRHRNMPHTRVDDINPALPITRNIPITPIV